MKCGRKKQINKLLASESLRTHLYSSNIAYISIERVTGRDEKNNGTVRSVFVFSIHSSGTWSGVTCANPIVEG